MNELSWLIYAADVAGDANSVCGFVFYAGIFSVGIYAVVKGVGKAISCSLGDYDDPPVLPSLASVSKKLWLPVLIAGVVGVATPSSSTIYAIAASEMGERVITSETGGKAVKALNAWLDKQVEGEVK